jgi:hypothetical protein
MMHEQNAKVKFGSNFRGSTPGCYTRVLLPEGVAVLAALTGIASILPVQPRLMGSTRMDPSS